MPKQSPTKDQAARFKQVARELSCDEDEAAFEKRLKRIAQAPPRKDAKSKPKAKTPAK